MDSSKDNSRLIWPLLLVTVLAAAIWASPFRYDHANSGRYLVVVAQKMDPGLFPGDPVVAAMGRFDSLFYRALPQVLGGPEQFESDLFKVFVVMKIALVLSLFWFIRTLTKEPLAAVLLLAWCSQNSAALLGDVPLFSNTVTHSEMVQVLGILAMVCVVKRRYLGVLAPDLPGAVHPFASDDPPAGLRDTHGIDYGSPGEGQISSRGGGILPLLPVLCALDDTAADEP